MIVLTWIGQILLFFIAWRALHWVAETARARTVPRSFFMELVVNLVVSIVLLIVVNNLHSTWWLMAIIGAIVGVITGQMSARMHSDGGRT